jgi:predicted short-subunit dehydrogenase-like oxidoreductase (DUF2520 family)
VRVTIVGRGRLGSGLAKALRRTSVQTTLTAGRSPRAAALRADAVVLAVPDPHVEAVARAVAPRLGPGTVALHCSGSLGPEVLAPLREGGAAVGAMHPLVSFADPKRPPALAGTSFVIDGDRRARASARRIARAVGARALVAPVHGAAYHAAAALSANGAAALATVAVRVYEALGLSRRDAQRAVGALLRTVGENVERIGVPEALSGPVIRGDAATVGRHRRALSALDDDARAAYDAVAPAILDCARRAGLPEERAAAVRRALRRRAR